MVSKYFERKTETKEFIDGINEILNSLKNKKVIIYGAGEGYFELNKKYSFSKNLNITAIADKKFETKSENITGLKQILPKQIINEEFDKIIITNEQPKSVKNYLLNTLEINEDKIVQVFNEEFKEECINIIYLYKHNFPETVKKLQRKLRKKSVLLYGAGAFLELILKYFDISDLNVIGISDKKYEGHKLNETFHGYKVYAPSEIAELKPDYVIVTTKFYLSLIEDLYYSTLRKTGIKIKPLVQKSLFTLLREIWN